MNHQLLYFMGPSGAGKDSIIRHFLQNLDNASDWIRLAQRTITRTTPDANENFLALSEVDFLQHQKQGDFFFSWHAHSTHYGISKTELEFWQQGGWLCINGSRDYLPQVLAKVPGCTTVHITASPQSLEKRLHARGRDQAESIESRLKRSPLAQPATFEIINEGSIVEASNTLLRYLSSLPNWGGHPVDV